MTEVFRVVGGGVTYGPYLTLGAARGVATSKRNDWHREHVEFWVERAEVTWESVE